MPPAYAGVAVGWTEYKFAPSSRTTIISTQTYLDPTVFANPQESNVTARMYALRLALHELGRVLGLGSVLDGHDIMDPMGTPDRARDPMLISVLDLYALKVLASGNAPGFVTLPGDVPNQLLNADNFHHPSSNLFRAANSSELNQYSTECSNAKTVTVNVLWIRQWAD